MRHSRSRPPVPHVNHLLSEQLSYSHAAEHEEVGYARVAGGTPEGSVDVLVVGAHGESGARIADARAINAANGGSNVGSNHAPFQFTAAVVIRGPAQKCAGKLFLLEKRCVVATKKARLWRKQSSNVACHAWCVDAVGQELHVEFQALQLISFTF